MQTKELTPLTDCPKFDAPIVNRTDFDRKAQAGDFALISAPRKGRRRMLTSSASHGFATLPDALTADRQLHFICEGWKKGLDFESLRRLVARFYGSEVKPCQLHWTEVDRLIIEIWRQDIRKDFDHY